MTKKERAIIIRAAELVASGEKFSCCSAFGGAGAGNDLIKRFEQFYEKSTGYYWTDALAQDVGLDEWDRYMQTARDARVLCLLTFAEVGE